MIRYSENSSRPKLLLIIATVFTMGVLAFSSTSVAAAEDMLSSTGSEIQLFAPIAFPPAVLQQVDCANDQEPLVAMVTTNGFDPGTATTLVADLT